MTDDRSDKILVGDCLDVLREFPESSVDALVTDPPWGFGKVFGEWTEPDSPEEYWKWLRPRYEASLRCVKPGGFVAVWQTQRYFSRLWEWFGDDFRVFIAARNFTNYRPTVPIGHWYEPIVIFYKRGAPPRFPERRLNRDWYIGDYWSVWVRTEKLEREHPDPKTVDVVEALLENFVVPGGIVLDPFLGSGTTWVACQRTGRFCWGIDIESSYVELSRRRIDGETTSRQRSLFGEVLHESG